MRRSEARLIAVLLPVVFFIALLAACILTQTVLAQTYPRCQSGCTANDADVTKLWFVSGTGCTQGSYTGQIYATFAFNRQNTYCIYSVVDVYVNGQPYKLNVGTKIGDSIHSGTIDLPISSGTWPCDSQVTVKNIYVQYDANGQCTYDCSKSGPSKCKLFPGPFTVPPPLIADFNYQGSCNVAPITFSDTTTGGDGSIESWTWDFGDGSATFSGQTPPPHKYANPGRYRVTLEIKDSQNVLDNFQTITSTTSHDIDIYGPPEANFTVTLTNICTPLTLTFTNTSNSNGRTITGWTWDFGDSKTYSGETPPPHIYPNRGTYAVKLTVTSACGSSTKISYVTVSQPAVVPGTYGPACVIGSNITLVGSPIGGTWLGDGVSGNVFNPSSAGPGDHVLTYRYASGSCSFSNTTTLTVVPLPQTTITVS